MNIKEFEEKHSEALAAYKEKLDKIISKREALNKYFWQLGIMMDYPHLNDSMETGDIYDPETSEVITPDQIKQKYLVVKRKLENPISADPEYRSAYEALLEDVYEDAAAMSIEADKAVTKARKTYHEKRDEYYNRMVDALNARVELKRQIRSLLFIPHENALERSDKYVRNMPNMKADTLMYSNFLTNDIIPAMDGYLRAMKKLDEDERKRHDPSGFQERYDSEPGTYPQTVKDVANDILSSRHSFYEWFFGKKDE